MNITNDSQVLALLTGAGKSAPEMTQGLSALGNGHMADGLITLWENGQKNGIVKGAVGASLVFTIGIGLYTFTKNKVAEHKFKQAIRTALSTAKVDETPIQVPVSEESNEKTPY